MNKFFEILLYGGISRNSYELIADDINQYNKKNVKIYSIIGFIAFASMLVSVLFADIQAKRNIYVYAIASAVMLILLLCNTYLADKSAFISACLKYIYVSAALVFGIMLAIKGKDDLTASFMILLFAAPLLFASRPIIIDVIILGFDIVYIIIMNAIQDPFLFHRNFVNAIVYGLISVFVCTFMSEIRIQKFETDYMNRRLMEIDQLTGMLNRRSYEQHIDKLNMLNNIEGVKICAFDVNGLKRVNDNIGHHAGDELIKGAASCIQHVFGNYGLCYRVGGDEFMAILDSACPQDHELITLLNKQTAAFKGTYIPSLSISSGIVECHMNDNIADMLKQADEAMYKNKAAYYKEHGIDRRKN